MNILFVCTGNTCRSPIAEWYLKSKNIPDLSVKSRGLSAGGEPISKNSYLVLKELGIDGKEHISTPISPNDLLWADRIFYMSPAHFTFLRLYVPESKLAILGNGISDPFGGDLEVYRNCRNQITQAIDRLIAEDFFTETVIVKAKKEHLKAISLLEKECFSTPWSEQSLLNAFLRNTVFFVAVKGEKVIGYVGLDCVLDEGYITNLAVTKSARRKGVGKALMERVVSHGKDEALSFISLEVRPSNQTAIKLYENLGFSKEGVRKNFYTDPKEDGFIYTKRF